MEARTATLVADEEHHRSAKGEPERLFVAPIVCINIDPTGIWADVERADTRQPDPYAIRAAILRHV
jgi:hypothetical protein